MKRSIKRLPKRTQEELAVLQELILSNLTNVRMIILYGSYAPIASNIFQKAMPLSAAMFC